MKYTKLIIAMLLVIGLMGCASTGFLMAKPKVTLYDQAYPTKSIDSKVDVFNTTRPDREYTEIAQIACRDTDDSWNMKPLVSRYKSNKSNWL